MVIIPSKEKSIVLLILAAMFYTVAFFLVGLSFYYDQFKLEESLITGRAILFGLIAFSMVAGIRLSQKRTLFLI